MGGDLNRTWMFVTQFNDLNLRQPLEAPVPQSFRAQNLVTISVTAIRCYRTIQSVPSSILDTIGRRDDDRTSDSQKSKPDSNTVTLKEARRGRRWIHVGGDEAGQVTTG